MTFFFDKPILTASLNFFSSKILHNELSSQITTTKIVDPVIKLLEDIKSRKINVIIPKEEDIITSLSSGENVKKSIHINLDKKTHGFLAEKPTRVPSFFRNQRNPTFPNTEQKVLLSKLKKIPCYVVVTKQNQMVMAVPREKEYKNMWDWCYKKYYNAFVWTEDHGPISLGLFFMHKEDAELYLHEVAKFDPKTAEKEKINVKIVTLDNFYKLNRTSAPGQQIKLIANLEEIEKIVLKYIPSKTHTINPKQKYSKTGYKGNPIYIIKPTVIKNRLEEPQVINYKIKGLDSTRNIFFKLEDAYLAWDKFIQDNPNLKLPSEPNIELYNLEDYLLDLEQSSPMVIKETCFIASSEAFENLLYTEKKMPSQNKTLLSKRIKKFTLDKFKKVQSFYKGIVWVLTSDTLPTEDNAW